MQSLLGIAGTAAIRFGMAATLALAAPALAAGDEKPDEETTSQVATTSEGGRAMAPSGSVTDFLTFDPQPDVASTSGDGSAVAAASVRDASDDSKNEK